jgi:TonB family protein
MTTEKLPRSFGNYSLIAAVGTDALGAVYRGVRLSEDRPPVLLRVLESPEISPEKVLDAIEENGEVHEFLKHAAIVRGVEMDAVDGVPFIAWQQPNGRTLDGLIGKCRVAGKRVPAEHALLIAEKVATALDHAYNTTVDGDRTLHGLVWPGFVAISDDGEIRLAGFGLAAGVLPSIRKPRVAAEVGRYLAPEERESGAIGRSSDVYSVGILLLEMLTGHPAPPDPFAAVKGVAGAPPPPVAPEILAVLRMALAPVETRYKTTGDLRRELGKLLFSGPYAPSTFNLAYFLNELFRSEIEAESRSRGAGTGAASAAPAASAPPERPRDRREPPPDAPHPGPLPQGEGEGGGGAARRGKLLVGAVVAAAAIAGAVLVLARKSPAPAARPTPVPVAFPAKTTPTLLPELAATPAGPTTTMSEADFREEVARRLAIEVQKLETSSRSRGAGSTRPTAPAEPPAEPAPSQAAELAATAPPAATPTAAINAAYPEAMIAAEPTAAPTAPPARVAVRSGALVELDDVDTPPRVAKVVKPGYPPLALQARIGGIVILRVLVSETGAPADIQVLRSGRAGLTEAAIRAVKDWTFQPAVKDGVPVRTWISVPIPFEP